MALNEGGLPMGALDTSAQPTVIDSLPAWLPSEVTELIQTKKWSGYSLEVPVTPRMIQNHAVTTGDFQDIHLSPARAIHADFTAPIAHGFLVLGLLPQLLSAYQTLIGASLHVVPTGMGSIHILNPVLQNAVVRASMRIIGMEYLNPSIRQVCSFAVEFRIQTQDPNTVRWKYSIDGVLSVRVYP